MFLEECNDASFYKLICKREHFLYLNKKNVIYPHVADIVQKHFEEDKENFEKIRKNSSKTRKDFSLSIYPSTLRSIAL